MNRKEEISSAIANTFQCQKDEETPYHLLELEDLLQKQEEEKLSFLCGCFHSIVEDWPDHPQKVPVLNLLIEAMVMTDNEKNEALLSLYWYYSYLCEHQIVDVLSVFITSLNIDHAQSFSWPWFSMEEIKNRYEMITATKSLMTDRSDEIDRITAKIERYKVRTLVPVILYARGLGDVENESWLLRFVWKKLNTEGIASRLSEVCGYDVPTEIKMIDPETRGGWITNRLKVCTKVLSPLNTQITEEDIWSIKKIYTVQPFNSVVIRALIVISVNEEEPDIPKMLEHSMNGVVSYISLGLLLTDALGAGSQVATSIILQRIAKLKNYETILHALDKIDFHVLRKNRNSRKSICMCLDFYDEITPKRDRNEHRAFTLRDKYDGVMYDRNLYLKMQNSWNEEEETSRLYDRNEYDALMKLLSKSTTISIKTLKIILKAAIELKSPTRIIEAYELMASIDPSTASFYNADVEPFIIVRNKYAKPTWSSNSLVSTMWGMPEKFLGPIDRKTALLAIPVKEIDSEE